MKAAPFAYAAPTSIAGLWDLLAEHRDGTTVLAGGQSLLPRLARRELEVARLVDLGRLAELKSVEVGDERTRLGAGVTQREAERSAVLAGRHPLLRAALAHVATPAVRARGTVCGSLAHGDPSAELPAALIALDATAVVASSAGERRVPLEALYLGPFTCDLAPGEILAAVELPATGQGWRDAFAEVGRRAVDVAATAAAVRVRVDAAGEVLDCRVVCAGAGPTPRRLQVVEALVRAGGIGPRSLRDVVDAVVALVDPPDDVRASAHYRRFAAGVLVRRCLEQAASPEALRAA